MSVECLKSTYVSNRRDAGIAGVLVNIVHYIWSGQVTSACLSMQQLGGSKVWGHACLSEKLPFWAKMMFLRGQTTEFHMYEYLLSCLLCRTALVLAFWSFANLASHTRITDESCETNCSLRRTESCWEEDSEEILLHCLQPSQHVASQCALCDVLCRNCMVGHPLKYALIGDTKQSQEWGKKWSSWNCWLHGSYIPAASHWSLLLGIFVHYQYP